MRILVSLFISGAVLFFSATTLQAETTKTIALKDGSKLKGKIIAVQNDVYTVQTDTLGKVNIPEADIISITTSESTPVYPTSSSSVNNPTIKEKVSDYQQRIMADPQIVVDLQNMAQDKEIMSILSDKSLMADVLSYDPERIKNNPKIQQLMQNPRFQNMLDKAGQKMSSPSDSQ